MTLPRSTSALAAEWRGRPPYLVRAGAAGLTPAGPGAGSASSTTGLPRCLNKPFVLPRLQNEREIGISAGSCGGEVAKPHRISCGLLGGRLGGPGPTGDNLRARLAAWPQIPPRSRGSCFASSQAGICSSRATVASSCWQRKCFRCLWSSLIAMFCHDRLFLRQTQREICEEKATSSSSRISSVTLDGTRAPHRLNQHPAGQKVPQKWKF